MTILAVALGMLFTVNVNAAGDHLSYNVCSRTCQTQGPGDVDGQVRCEAFCRCVYLEGNGNIYCAIRDVIDNPGIAPIQQTNGSRSVAAPVRGVIIR